MFSYTCRKDLGGFTRIRGRYRKKELLVVNKRVNEWECEKIWDKYRKAKFIGSREVHYKACWNFFQNQGVKKNIKISETLQAKKNFLDIVWNSICMSISYFDLKFYKQFGLRNQDTSCWWSLLSVE